MGESIDKHLTICGGWEVALLGGKSEISYHECLFATSWNWVDLISEQAQAYNAKYSIQEYIVRFFV